MDKVEQRKINVILADDIHKRLRHESVEKRQSMSVIISETLSQHFNRTKDNGNDK